VLFDAVFVRLHTSLGVNGVAHACPRRREFRPGVIFQLHGSGTHTLALAFCLGDSCRAAPAALQCEVCHGRCGLHMLLAAVVGLCICSGEVSNVGELALLRCTFDRPLDAIGSCATASNMRRSLWPQGSRSRWGLPRAGPSLYRRRSFFPSAIETICPLWQEGSLQPTAAN